MFENQPYNHFINYFSITYIGESKKKFKLLY